MAFLGLSGGHAVVEQSFGPVVVRRRLGSELRRLRERAGLSLEQAALEMEVSPSKLSRLETGLSTAKVWDVRNLLTLYGVDDADYRRRAERWVNEARAQGYWHDYSDAVPSDLDHYASLEAEAARVQAFCTPYLHSLLQTRSYARAFLSGVLQGVRSNDLNGLVEVRVQRQRVVLGAQSSVRVEIVIDEATLHRRVGALQTMVEQLQHLRELASRIDLRIKTLESKPHVAILAPFTIFHPRESNIDPTVVNVESAFHDAYWDSPNEVQRYISAFEDLQQTALSASESVELLEQLCDRGGDPPV